MKMTEHRTQSTEHRGKYFFYFLLSTFYFLLSNPSAQVLSGSEIEMLCKEKIESLIQDERIEIIGKSLPDIILPEGSITIEGEPRLLYQNAIVDVRILVDGVEKRRIRPLFKVRRFKDVFVAARLIKPKDVITEDMIRKEEREITNISGYITEREKIVGNSAGRMIQEGNMILLNNIKELPLINFGDIVSLIKNGNGFSIKARAMAVSTGYKGKKISVRNLSSNKIIEGIVIDRGVVEVR